ncbi:hypothetical protein JMJ77_0002021, partial [Colletotrichum scovillei]
MESMNIHTRTKTRLRPARTYRHAFKKPSLWRAGPLAEAGAWTQSSSKPIQWDSDDSKLGERASFSTTSGLVFGAALINRSQARLSSKACSSSSDAGDDSSSEDIRQYEEW